MLSVVSYQAKGQILLLDFNVGSEANCNAYTDWVENGQVYLREPLKTQYFSLVNFDPIFLIEWLVFKFYLNLLSYSLSTY